ncbi:MAG: hypothetical protein BGO41_05505 [Clostridiales bacterium 38-18]|nr:MAG: hypothetical protein BGO41_05505 [Clostridiales bacterium 38-18]
MAIFVFFINLTISIYILFRLSYRAFKEKYESNLMLIIILVFNVLYDLNRLGKDNVNIDWMSEVAIFLFLLYFLTRVLTEKTNPSGYIRSFIDVKTLFDSEIVSKLDEGIALIKNDTMEVLYSNERFKAWFGDEKEIVPIEEVIRLILRGQFDFELVDAENHKVNLNGRIVNYGTKFALIYFQNKSEVEYWRAQIEHLTSDLYHNWNHSEKIIIIRNKQGVITFANQSAADFLHKSISQIIGVSLSGIYNLAEEAAIHLQIQEKLINREAEFYKGIIQYTYAMRTTGYLQIEEQLIHLEDREVLLTSGSIKTEKYFLDLLQSAYQIIHQKGIVSPHSTYVVADLIHYDLLFKERFIHVMNTPIHSLNMFIGGLTHQDRIYFEHIIESPQFFQQKIICYNEVFNFWVEECIFTESGHLSGIAMKYMNSEVISDSQSIIGPMILNHVKEGILIVNSFGFIEYANEMIQRLLEYDNNMIGMNYIELSEELTHDSFKRNMEMTKQHQSLHFERVYNTMYGDSVPIEVVAMNFVHHSEDKLLLLLRDVSEKFNYKRKLVDSQSKYALMFEAVQDSIIEIVLPSKTVNLYREFDLEKGIVGIEISFLQWLNSVYFADQAVVYEAIDVITAEKSRNFQFEFRQYKKGVLEWYFAQGKYISTSEGASVSLSLRNITDLKNTELKLDETISILHEIEEITRFAYCTYDSSTNSFEISSNIVSWLKQDTNRYNNTNEGAIKWHYDEMLKQLYPLDLDYFEDKFSKLVLKSEPFDVIIRFHNHGKIILTQVYLEPILHLDQIIGAKGFIRDVTENASLQQGYDELKSLVQKMLDKTEVAYVVVRGNGQILYCNQRALDYLESTSEALQSSMDLVACLKSKYHTNSLLTLEQIININGPLFEQPVTEALYNKDNSIAFRLEVIQIHNSDQHLVGKIVSISLPK